MGLSIENITTQDAYVPANTFGQGTPMVAGWFIVANAVAAVQLTTGVHGQPSKQEEVSCPPGIYPIQSNPKNPITTIAFRSFVAGSPAQVIGAVFYPSDSYIQSGGSFDAQITPGGGVTPPGGAVITGRVDIAGSVGGGSGFTSSRFGMGVYDLSYTTPFTNAPVVLATAIPPGVSSRVIVISSNTVATTRLLIFDDAGVLADSAFDFTATPIV